MTLQERYELSCYQELMQPDEAKKIWLVRHQETNKLYIKKILQWYNQDIYRRLMETAFPNIPRIALCIREEDTLIVIEEYIHGSSLEQLLQDSSGFSEEYVAGIILAVCTILEPLHRSTPPIIHRDIKPSNIMISSDGIVKLIDFNAAKEYDQNRNRDTRLMGTRHFAAPEQYGFGQSDPRTDLYALGVTMYYLLTGDFPDSRTYHGSLLPIIEKCIPMDKAMRYPDVSSMKRDLQKWNSTRHTSRASDHSDISTAGGSQQADINHIAAADTRNQNPWTRPRYSYQPKAPVGFRSGALWKMLLSLWGHLCIFWLCGSLTASNKNGPLTGYPLYVNRIGALLFFLGTIMLCGNYCHIRDYLPVIGRGFLARLIATIIYVLLYGLIIISCVVFLGGS